MTREEAISWILDEKSSLERAPYINGCAMTEDWQRAIDVYDIALSAIHSQQDQVPDYGKMMPLTLDELRKMDGEPVWIVEYPDWGHWELSADAEDYVTDREPSFYGMKHNDPDGRYGLHKLGWIAYRQKPEEDCLYGYG